MSDYATELAKITRIPVTFAVMTLDYCSLTYGVGACTATSTRKCYNTYPTCRAKSVFDRTTKDYEFCSNNSRLPYSRGERPYIKSCSYLPTEIKDSLTVSSRVTIEMYDEPDTDVGIDPYLADRSSVQGTYWKKLLARNTNWKGRIVKIYDGFVWREDDTYTEETDWEPAIAWDTGIEWASRVIHTVGAWSCDFEQKFVGAIDNITLNKGVVKIEVVDLLQSLNDITIPPELDLELAADMTDSQVTLTLDGTDIASLDATGYVRIDDEIIYYGAIDAVTGILSSLTRASFGTTAAVHDTDTSVQKVRYFAPDNGFDIIQELLLTDCGIDAAYVDTTGIDAEKALDIGDNDVDFSAIISEPMSAKELFFELISLLNCRAWVGEDLKITVKRNLPNYPGRSYTELSDANNIIKDSTSVDLNKASRISRAAIYWDRTAIGDEDEAASYSRLDIGVDADAEGVNEYNEIAPKTIYSRWLRFGYDTEENMKLWVKNQCLRLIGQFRDPMPLIQLNVEIKDSGIKTGGFVRLTTDEVLDIDGNDLDGAAFLVVKREQKEQKVTLKLLQITPKKYLVIAPADYDSLDFDDATAAQREYGAICDNNNQMTDGTDGYRIY